MRENHARASLSAPSGGHFTRGFHVAPPMLGILSMRLSLSSLVPRQHQGWRYCLMERPVLTGNYLKLLLSAVASYFVVTTAAQAGDAPNTQNTPSRKTETIPWNQIGAKAGADYKGEGLSVAATRAGARLQCVFQRLDGEATG